MRRAVFFAAALAACDPKSAPPPAAHSNSVETVSVVSKRLQTTDRLPAQLLAYESVEIYSKVTGFIDQLRVDVGSRVKKGDLLVRLSAPELVSQRAQAQASLHAAESRLASAQAKLVADESTYERLSTAAKTPGVVAGNDVTGAAQAVAADRASVAAAEATVTASRDGMRAIAQMESYLAITAPFSGVVTRRNLHPGALTGPASGTGATPILQLVDTDRLRLVVPVPEAEAAGIVVGRPVPFTVAAQLGETFQAPIARVSQDVNLTTRTMHVELEVDNKSRRLAPGSFATVVWPVERTQPTLFVPTSAIANDQQKTFVIRANNGVAEWVPVQTGLTSAGEVEIVGDVHAGDKVARFASDAIRNGQRLN